MKLRTFLLALGLAAPAHAQPPAFPEPPPAPDAATTEAPEEAPGPVAEEPPATPDGAAEPEAAPPSPTAPGPAPAEPKGQDDASRDDAGRDDAGRDDAGRDDAGRDDADERIRDLKTPTSPAFALIGVVPSEVESPRTPKDVAMALYDNLREGRLQPNIALEIAPYWLVAHPELTYDEYTNARWYAQVLQNLTLSAATAEVVPAESDDATADEATAEASMDVAFGIRSHMFWTNRSAIEALEKVTAAEATLLTLHNTVAERALYEALNCAGLEPSAPEPCPKLKANLAAADQAEQALAAAAESLQQALAMRPGFSLSVAGAIAYRSPANEIDLGGTTKEAAWLTGGYRDAPLDVAALARYTHVASELRYFDAGARIALIRPRYGLCVEAVGRWFGGADAPVESSGRLAGTVEFALTEDVILSGTFGKALDDEEQEGGTITLLGVSFQAARERKLTDLPEPM